MAQFTLSSLALNILIFSSFTLIGESAFTSTYLTDQFYANCNTSSKVCVALGANVSQDCISNKNCTLARATMETSTDFVLQIFYTNELRQILCDMYKPTGQSAGTFQNTVQKLKMTVDATCKDNITLADIHSFNIQFTKDPCLDIDYGNHTESRGNLITTTVRKTDVKQICIENMQDYGKNVTSVETFFEYHLIDGLAGHSCGFNPERLITQMSITNGYSTDSQGNQIIESTYSTQEIECNFQTATSGSGTFESGRVMNVLKHSFFFIILPFVSKQL